ncbi:glycoside hydrolase family 28 protein [Lentithecium fluviatile CBS 122367]|uniref:Glycoside hydrolase family 28 protein n=1 Tax=Lentithecium fluviatile CBS 122367 TaxID=1168545 RepID=A0A6G1J4F3_9PLEO|nr:glycoside hydrolase family 28 protein [Lentithecium fluviatile CBS 122367]
MRASSITFSAVALLPAVLGQLSGSVGPLTTTTSKAAKTCDVTKYGAKADKTTDLGPPLQSAWAACASGGTVVIPTGDYAMSTWVTLKNGKKVAIQLDGVIYRTGTANGNMIMVRDTSDFEMFSSTGKGAIQGLGYEFHKNDVRSNTPRLLRFYKVTDFSLHDISLVDAPLFHFVLDTCTNGEVYNMAVQGGDWGGLDGIDVWSNNIWIHDVMVSNKDECVTVKSPSKNILIENIYCNWSGGCAIGSLGLNTAISSIHYRNIYTWKSNQMMMIKDNGGSGYVEDVVFENFIGHSNAYAANIDQYWSSMSSLGSTGAQLSNITYKNWKGTQADGSSRGYLKAVCSNSKPCTDITLTDIAMWTETGSKMVNQCQSGYGTGSCLKKGTSTVSYAVTKVTETAAPTGYSAASMPNNLKTGWNRSSSIPIPTIPTSYFPGATPIKKVAGM